MILPAPHIRILVAALATLQTVDWQTETGVQGLKLRHMRHRFSTSSEIPCLALRWTGNDSPNVTGDYDTAQERRKHCNMDLVLDMPLSPEDSVEDPTGWAVHSSILSLAVSTLQAPGDPNLLVPTLSDWIISGDDVPDEDSTPDNARLVKSLSVVYRVRTDDENVLLAAGVNG